MKKKEEIEAGNNLELLPCPFCGHNEAPIIMTEDELDEGYKGGMFIICCRMLNGGCGAASRFEFKKIDAIEAWNIRTD